MEVLPRLEDIDAMRDMEDMVSIAGTVLSNMEDDLEDFEILEGLTLPLYVSTAQIKRLAAELDIPKVVLVDEVCQRSCERWA